MSGKDHAELPAGAPKAGDIFAEKFRIEKVLGVGGMGFVLAATHLHLRERVAIKLLLPERALQRDAVARFLREGRAAVRIRSMHVARVLDVGSASGTPYMVMEYLEGSDLAAVLERRSRLPIPLAVDWLLQACEAVAEAHALGTVHRDLKPSNLFVVREPDGREYIKVLDFGISKSIATGEDDGAAVTKTAATVGTPRYMSPEQLKSSKSVDARADIWSLGVILFELVTGRAPFGAPTVPELCVQILTTSAPDVRMFVPEASPELAAAIATSLRPQADERFPSVAELAEAIAPFGTESARTSAGRISQVLENVTRPPSNPSSPAALDAYGVAVDTGGRRSQTTTGTWGAATAETQTSTKDSATRTGLRRPSVLAATIAGAALALAVVGTAAGAGVAKLLGRGGRASAGSAASAAPSAASGHEPADAAPASTPAAPATTPDRVVVVSLDAPPSSIVEVDGTTVEVRGGSIEIRGLIGSVHAVRIAAGRRESKTDVVIAETGAVPARVALAPTYSAAGAVPRPGPTASAAPAPKPPSGAPTINRNF